MNNSTAFMYHSLVSSRNQRETTGSIGSFGLLLAVIFSRIPFLAAGFGRPDAWACADTGKLLVLYGQYWPSRPPGFPLVELLSALCFASFGNSPADWIVSNALTLVVFTISVIAVWSLAKKWGVKSPLLVASVYAFAPLNWVYSVQTIDYLWATALVVFSILAIESGRRREAIIAGALLGLATSARFLAAILLIPLLIIQRRTKRPPVETWSFVLSFAVVTLVSYAIVFIHVKDWGQYLDWFHELNRVSAGLAQVEGGTFAKRFLMPSSQVFGPLATIAIVIAFLGASPAIVGKIRRREPGTLYSILLIAFIIAPYLWHLHPNYVIPAIPFILILLALNLSVKSFAIVGALILAANIPFWQTEIEGLGIFRGTSLPGNIAALVEPYQNENVFEETASRDQLLASVEEFLNYRAPSDWIVMASIRLSMIKFLVPDIERASLPLTGGGSVGVWRPQSGGPGYVYFLSPEQVHAAVKSGYHVVYLPGMETSYLASYGVRIEDVPGVEVLYRND